MWVGGPGLALSREEALPRFMKEMVALGKDSDADMTLGDPRGLSTGPESPAWEPGFCPLSDRNRRGGRLTFIKLGWKVKSCFRRKIKV